MKKKIVVHCIECVRRKKLYARRKLGVIERCIYDAEKRTWVGYCMLHFLAASRVEIISRLLKMSNTRSRVHVRS